MTAPTGLFASIILLLSISDIKAHAQVTEESNAAQAIYQDILRCAGGSLSENISGTLEGAVNRWTDGLVRGNYSNTSDSFISSFEDESLRLEAYRLYLDCLSGRDLDQGQLDIREKIRLSCTRSNSSARVSNTGSTLFGDQVVSHFENERRLFPREVFITQDLQAYREDANGHLVKIEGLSANAMESEEELLWKWAGDSDNFDTREEKFEASKIPGNARSVMTFSSENISLENGERGVIEKSIFLSTAGTIYNARSAFVIDKSGQEHLSTLLIPLADCSGV
jgi:hypothetical protein